MSPAASRPLDLADVRRRIDDALSAGLRDRADHLTALGVDLVPVADALVGFCQGGKRIRPLFGYCGWRAAAGDQEDDAVVRAVSSLELVQAAALVHDDIIDESDSRRGRPSVHRAFEQQHRSGGYAGDAAKHGVATAILIGDLALIWADALVQAAGLDDAALLRVRHDLDLMRIEVMSGQYLDVLEQARPAPPEQAEESALRVAELKSASYTVARPMLIGAAIADAGPDIRAAYASFGHHVGIAFQLRDDLLGVFGDPTVTGKPAGDDLREGKRTVLVARALQRLGDRAADVIDGLGRPDLDSAQVDRLRDLLIDSGAPAEVEALIEEHSAAARAALSRVTLDREGLGALDEMVDAATARAH
ncbi:polyprenyl synthetase family protein [Blastococcus sp. Marseille-P5729]|uniref:polyprenyl synthetase family protein n=1 Tax=Blastococcus sp. Marseille-P5729 TaxID=2086582 RepID=UPI0018FEFCD9|nr:polyprenyl synthetase family protein [Blastococcus sp. Marseille-P5729]